MPNQTPTADAGEDRVWSVDKTVVLDGSGSHDLDGDPLTYNWTFVVLPDASPLTDADIEDATSPVANFLPHHFGEFRLRLEVSDGEYLATDLVSIYAKENVPPIPSAGDDIQLELGEPAFLDANASGDPDGDSLIYSWSFLKLPEQSLLVQEDISGADQAEAFFVPDVTGEFQIQLDADDGFFVAEDTVLVVVEESGFGCSTTTAIAPSFALVGILTSLLWLRHSSSKASTHPAALSGKASQ
jgi:hypothetical protein